MAKSKTIENLFFNIALTTASLPFLFFIINYKKVRYQKGLMTIALYSLFVISVNLAFHLPLSPSIELFLRSSYTLFEFLFFSYFFFITTTNKKFKKLVIGSSALFTCFTVIYYFLAHVKNIDSIPIGIESILIITFSFYYLFEQLNQLKNFFIYTNYSFWIVLGFTFYLSGSFFIYLFASQSPEAIKYWFLTDIFSSFKDVLFVIGMVSRSRHQPYKHEYSLLSRDV